jgi:carboxypeptidase Taq
MQVNNSKINKLLAHYTEIATISKINAILQWDMNVNLPIKGANERAGQSAYLTKLLTDKWNDLEFKKLLQNMDETDTNLNKEESAVVRNLKHAANFYYRIPKKTIVEFSEVTSKAFMVWQDAKKDNNFKVFLPHLKKVVDLCKDIADKLGYSENPYDALLDLYEPGLTAKDCVNIFGVLQPELTKLVKRIKRVSGRSNAEKLIDGVRYPIEDQKKLAEYVMHKMGYDLEAGRMDVSSHPFTETLGSCDVRITNRYKETDFRESLMGAMHETGHALYEQGVSDKYSMTPLDGGVSLGIHESQSRFWENQIGRSHEFIKFLLPELYKYFPDQFGKIDSELIFRSLNLVKPSFIRTEADEVTYNLHIALRFEIEEALVNDRFKVQDLPEIWREKMKLYLGVVPKTDREGVLQDVHWSGGMFGYFPTYTLGNLYAAQFTRKLQSDLFAQSGIKLQSYIAKGDFETILKWLRKNIHEYGSLYWPKELIKKVTGEELNPKYFLEYIKSKYSKIYKL